MTDYHSYEYPLPVFYQQELTGSLDDGLERFDGYNIAPAELYDLRPFSALTLQTPRALAAWPTRIADSYTFPEWSSNLFGHILVIPARLDLGNILSNQTRTIEIANLFLTAQEWRSLATDVAGLVFINPPAGLALSPAEPFSIASFGSYLLQISISSDGPATIDGDIVMGFEAESVTVPVTGTRLVIFPFAPRPDISEALEWRTDILTAKDGTEQRAGIRAAPRQAFKLDVILDTASDRRMRGMLFDWLPRIFAVPIWWEARHPTAPVLAGATTISVSTLYGDFRVGGLVMLWAANTAHDALEITSVATDSLGLASEVSRNFGIDAFVMPARQAFAKNMPAANRVPNSFAEYAVEFVTVDNVNLADITGQSIYEGRVLLDDCNLTEAAAADSFERPVTVLDNESGRIFQTSRVDRSRYRTRKMWDAPTPQELWRVRRLLHYLSGSRLSFWLPTFRDDMTLTQVIGPSASTFRIEDIGFTAFYQSRRPFGDVRLTKTDGTKIIRRIIDAEVDGIEEVLTIDAPFDVVNPIQVADVARLEFVMLVRIADDRAVFLHRRVGDAGVAITLTTINE